jgi:hypothetical protein
MILGVNFASSGDSGGRQYRTARRLNEVCSLFPVPLIVFPMREDVFDVQVRAKADVRHEPVTIAAIQRNRERERPLTNGAAGAGDE